MAWTSVDFILNQSISRYHHWREEMHTAKKQACGVIPNSVGLKDKHVFVKTAVLIWNPPYYNGDIVEKRDHHDFRMAIWPPCRLVSGADMHGFCWEYHNYLDILCLNVDYERECCFLLGKYFILVEHISTVVLDAKTLHYRKEADKCPQSMRSDHRLGGGVRGFTSSVLSFHISTE